MNQTPVTRKIYLRIVFPFLFLLFLNSLNRVNISFASAAMELDIGLTPDEYGFGVSLFFIAFLLMKVPSVWLLKKIGMRAWLSSIVFVWGCAAAATAFVESATEFYVLRVVLGTAEAGFAAGQMYYLTQWLPKRYRAMAISAVLLAVPISIVLGGPLSGWLMTGDNVAEMSGWRWMLLAESLPTLLMAGIVLLIFVDEPSQATWLSEDERKWLTHEIDTEYQSQSESVSVWKALARPRLWSVMTCWFAVLGGAYGLMYWLPRAIDQMSSNLNDLEIGLVTGAPWLATAAGLLLGSWHSDRTQERYWHVGLPTLLSGILLLLATTDHAILSFAVLMLVGFFLGAAQGTIWTIPPLFLDRESLATGVVVISVFGSLSGVVVPALIGWLRSETGNFVAPVFALSAMLVVGGSALLLARQKTMPGNERD